jgi:hypothetical protein
MHDIWAAVIELGLTDPVPGLPADITPTDLAGSSSSGREAFVVLAARRHPDPDGVREALAYLQHDVLGVMVMLAPAGPGTSWQSLEQTWVDSTAGVPFEATLGTASVLLGLLPRTDWAVDPREMGKALRAAVPEPHSGGWPPCWCSSPDLDLVLWELPWRERHGVTTHRRLLAIAPTDREADLDAWVWTSGGPGLTPLTRYLLHTAKIRYEYAVLMRDLPRLRRLKDDVVTASGELFTAVEALDPQPSASARSRRTTSLSALRAAAGEVTRVSTMTDGLVRSRSRLETLAETLRFAWANASASIAPGSPSQPGSPFVVDQQLADVLGIQSSSEAAALRAVANQASELERFADRTLDGYLRDRQAELTLTQTTVLGGLLMILAAIQAFNYTVPLPGPVQAPVIALLGSLALALPLALPWWGLLDLGRTGAVGILPHVAVALVGASCGWLVCSLIARLARDGPAPAEWSAAAALAFALAALGVNVLVIRHRGSTKQ